MKSSNYLLIYLLDAKLQSEQKDSHYLNKTSKQSKCFN